MNDSFYSMDHLVEFGMSIAVANQMVNSMNQALRQMDVPGAGKSTNIQPETLYYAILNGEQSGPYSLADISRLINEKRIVKETYLWKPGMSRWDLAENISEIVRLVAIAPPPIPIAE